MATEEGRKHSMNVEKNRKRKQVHPVEHEKREDRKGSRSVNRGTGERRKQTGSGERETGRTENTRTGGAVQIEGTGDNKKRRTAGGHKSRFSAVPKSHEPHAARNKNRTNNRSDNSPNTERKRSSLADGYGKEPMRQTKRQKKKKKKNLVSNLILVVAIAVFLVSGFQLVRMLVPYFTGGAEYKEVKKMAEWNNDSDKAKQKAAKFQVNFDKLKEINPDTVAWIRFDEPAVISYPVVQTDNNDTYLKKTFQANDNKLGAIFMDYQNASDFSDRNTMIYGHNLKVGGEMFSQLKDYSEESFYKDHPYFYIYTPDGKTRTYQIFAAGVVKDTADNFRLSYTSDEDYESYLQLAKGISSYNTGVEVNKDSKIVTLSTCTNVKEDERFLVYGVLTKEETADSDSEDAAE